jgi:hypothetical protein
MTAGPLFRGLKALPPLLLLGLAACAAEHDADAGVVARRPDPPQLWLVQVIGKNGMAAASTYVCADTPLREAFVRTPQVEGAPCTDVTRLLLRDHEWALRCQARGRQFAVSTQTLGDVTQDFRLDSQLTPVVRLPGIEPLREARRFRHLGPCPAGWRVGDHAKPGEHPRRPKANGVKARA